MRALFAILRALVYLAMVLGVCTLAVPLFLLGAYLLFLRDCFEMGKEAYRQLTEHHRK